MPIKPGYTAEPNDAPSVISERTVIIQDNYLFDNTVTSYVWHGNIHPVMLSDSTVAIFRIKPKKQSHD